MPTERRVLVFGADGLRPDQITPEIMPTLTRLAASGVRFDDFHSVYPTHTRVVATSFATGRTPGQHGVVANTMIVPGATDDHIIDTGDYQHLDALAAFDPAGAQLVPTLSEILGHHGARLAVAGTGSSGSNALWTFKDRGRIVNTGTAYGLADLYDLREKLGPVPDRAIPNEARNRYATSAVTDIYLRDPEARVITLWLAEPDSTLHYTGIGSPETTQALRNVDACLDTVLTAMDRQGVREQFDILFLSDHGHSTVRAHRTLREYLNEARTDLGGSLPSLVTASDYIYAQPGTEEPTADALAPLVEWLHDQLWVDVISGGTDDLAGLPGVLPLNALWNGSTNHRRPLLAISPRWSHEPNEFGVPGTVDSLTTQAALKSSHGSLSPYDLHCTFIAHGPSFREGVVSSMPSGVTDVMPTILDSLGLDSPSGLDGRVLREAFAATADPIVEKTNTVLTAPGATAGRVIIHRVEGTTYLHGSDRGGEFPLNAPPADA
ncbi:MAG: alkaline phosphatase family protein [Thermomicrobiales bacterium]